MNARTDTALTAIAPSAMVPSRTAAQALRRKRVNPAKISEMAASMRELGMLEPILARESDVGLEIVAGEHRWLAAQEAGLATVPVIVRQLTDAEVLRVQLIENIQRNDFLPLEEAAGYKEILDTDKEMTAEAIGAAIGKSRAYVYSRIKLLQLIPDAQAKLQDGTLDASKGLLIARFKSPKLQAKVLEFAEDEDSFRDLVGRLRRDFAVRLDIVPFKLDDADVLLGMKLTAAQNKEQPHLDACSGCPHNSANDAELQQAFDTASQWGAATPAGTPMCIHKPCHDLKLRAHWARIKADAIAAGATILTGAEAKRVLPGQYDDGIGEGYVELDARSGEAYPEAEPEQRADESDEDFEKREDAYYDRQEAFEPRTYRQILGDEATRLPVIYAEDPETGALRELAPLGVTIHALKSVDYDTSDMVPVTRGPIPQSEADAKAAERERQKAAVEEAWREALLKQVHAKFKGPFKKTELLLIAQTLQNRISNHFEELLEIGDGDTNAKLDGMDEAALQRYIVAAMFAECLQRWNKPDPLVAAAKRLRIDPAKVKKDVTAEIKKAAKAVAE